MSSISVDDSAAPRRTPARPQRPGWLPDVDVARCTGCGWCVAACDLHLLSLEVVQWRKSSVLHDAERCTGCSDCAVVCPVHAITMRRSDNARVRDVSRDLAERSLS